MSKYRSGASVHPSDTPSILRFVWIPTYRRNVNTSSQSITIDKSVRKRSYGAYDDDWQQLARRRRVVENL